MDNNSKVFVEYKILFGRNSGMVMSRLFFSIDTYTKWILANEIGNRGVEIISTNVMTDGKTVFKEARA